MKKIILLLSILSIAFHFKSNAQGSFDEIAKLNDKAFSKAAKNQHPPKGDKRGQSGPYWAAFNGQIPRKIALVTFYVYDKPFSEIQKSSHNEYMIGSEGVGLYEVTTYTKYTKNLTKDGASVIASDFFDQCRDSLVKSFSDRGVQLLLPDQFLDSPEKQKYYNDFEPEISGIFKGMLNKSEQLSAVAGGFRFIPVPTDIPGEYKFMQSMGELARGLGVDAVLLVTNKAQVVGRKGYEFNELHLNLYGANPVPKVEGGFYPGRAYCTGLLFDSESYYTNTSFLTLDKKGLIVSKTFDGYEIFISKLSRLLLDYVGEQVKKDK